jgi:hypothetical protein
VREQFATPGVDKIIDLTEGKGQPVKP